MTDKSEIKVFILHLMDRIGYSVNCNDICSILSQENIAGYFECGDCFTELIEAGHIIDSGEVDDKGEITYLVTESGRTIASVLGDQISSAIKEASYRSAIRYLSFEKRGAIVNCHKTRLDSGKYSVHCEIIEKGRCVLEINIDVDTEKEADMMLFNFRRRPEVIYQGTMALVSGEKNYIFEK